VEGLAREPKGNGEALTARAGSCGGRSFARQDEAAAWVNDIDPDLVAACEQLAARRVAEGQDRPSRGTQASAAQAGRPVRTSLRLQGAAKFATGRRRRCDDGELTRRMFRRDANGCGALGIEPEPLPERVPLTRSRAGSARARTASPAASAGETEQRDGDRQPTPDVAPMDVDAAASGVDAQPSGDSSSATDDAPAEAEPAATTADRGDAVAPAAAEPLADAASGEGPSVDDGDGSGTASGPAESVTSPTAVAVAAAAAAAAAAAPPTTDSAAVPADAPPKTPTPAPLDGMPFVREDSPALLEWLVRNTAACDLDQLWALYVDLSNTVADRFRDGKMTSMKERWQHVLRMHGL